MEVIVAKTAGFCFGVRRAVEQVYQQIEQQKKQKDLLPIYTYGPIIHNEEVVRDLEEKGVYVIDSKEELEKLEKGVIILRAHGVTRNIYDLLENLYLNNNFLIIFLYSKIYISSSKYIFSKFIL